MKYGNLTLGQIEAGINKIGGEDAFMRLLAGDLHVVVAKPSEPKKLLELVTTTSVAGVEGFKAADYFTVDTKKAAVRIAWIGHNFSTNFLGLFEGICDASDIKAHKLLEHSLDTPIITVLAEKCEIKLGQFFALLSKQGKGEVGPLLTSGYANIVYIRDVNGILWAVYARWGSDGGGWGVEANSIEDPRRWGGGDQVLSR